MRLYDTKTKTYQDADFPELVKIYVCGITPYDSAHIGHIFTFLTYDLLARRLEDAGHEVQMVRNITDVDEPMYKKAAEMNTDYMTLAKNEVELFHSVVKQLKFLPLHAEPRASEYIEKIAVAVKKLLDNRYAYQVDSDIYFDTSKIDNFGEFSSFDQKLLIGLFKERGGDPERSGKRQTLDFLLWKHINDANDPAQWETVVGNGRPGWHIECSIMSSDLLGNTFDVHGGGSDLIFPHHECEIAQSVALNGEEPARLWIHTSPMFMAGEKMSKSLGNMVFAKDVLEEFEPSVIRLALMHYHHRVGGEWLPELLTSTRDLLAKFRKSIKGASQKSVDKLVDNIRCALDDDINTLEAIDAINMFVETTGISDQGQPNIKTIESLLGIKL